MSRIAIEVPRARQIPQECRVHNTTFVDPYAWLRQRDSQEVMEYLEAENAYTQAVMEPTEALQEVLYKEMVGRIQETDQTVPVRKDQYLYYSRTEAGLQYPIYCRRLAPQGEDEGEEQVLIDLNALSKKAAYLELGVFHISPDHRLLAYSLDEKGDERFVLRFKNPDTGEELPEAIPNTAGSLIWANDCQTVFYATLDETRRPYRVYRHQMGENPANDELMFEEKDERFFLGLFKTRSRRFLGIELGSKTTSEVLLLEDVPCESGTAATTAPSGRFKSVFPRRQGIEYSIDHHGDDLYILTNEEAQNFRLLKVPVDAPDLSRAEEILPHRPTVKLENIDLFERHLVVYLRYEGLRQIQIHDLVTGASHQIESEEPVFTLSPSSNPMFSSKTLRFAYSSLVTPRTIYDYDMDTRQKTELKRTVVGGDFEASRYASERIFATAPDGVRVPISLVYRDDLERDGKRPMLLYGYGSYGSSIDPRFSSSRLSLLDRGFIFAIAHIRGGGENGRPWYENGKLLHKKNTFTDFLAAAHHLIDLGYTSSDRLAIRGGSAGGMLIGVALNEEPELFAAAIAEVPFVDVLNTMLDPTIPLTVAEYEEWGNPEQQEYFDYIRSYSPYDNVGPHAYPHLLVTAGLNDPRVQYWEPAKWTAKLRHHQSGGRRLLLRVEMTSGHRGASGRYDALREEAFKLAFLFDVIQPPGRA